jgi:hypothetical protein
MNIKNTVIRYFELTMPFDIKEYTPGFEEFPFLWSEFLSEATSISQEFSAQIPLLKSKIQTNIIKNIILNLNEMTLFANENIIFANDLIRFHKSEEQVQYSFENLVDGILSLLQGRKTPYERRKERFNRLLLPTIKKFEKKHHQLISKYYNLCAEAETIFIIGEISE